MTGPDGKEDKRALSRIHGAMGPVRRHIGNRPSLHLQSLKVTFFGLHQQIALALQTQVYLSGVHSNVEVALGHIVLISHLARIEHSEAM